MGRIKPRFRGPPTSVAIACIIASQMALALPSQERQLSDPLLEPVDLSVDIVTKAPLMGRTGGESGSAHARYLRQVLEVEVFEASHSTKLRRDWNSQEDQPGQPAALNHELSELRSSSLKHPISIVDHDHFQTQSDMDNSEHPNTVAGLDAPIIAGGGKRLYPRDHHHSHHPDDHSRGGHSDHWYEHHGLNSAAYHRNHRHHHSRQRGKGPGPSRLVQARDPATGDDEEVTLIAPPSAESDRTYPSDAPGRVAKEGTGQGTEVLGGHRVSDQLDKRTASRSMDGVPGIIDLMQGSSNGEKLGGLSISFLPPNDTALISISKVFALLIDSTPNLIDQATFFMHTLEGQSILDHYHPSARAPRELLVALEVLRTSNGTIPQRMCATFNPLEMDVQIFGLALCMDQDSAINNRRMSQAFRYSPETGVLAPYYGAEEARNSVLAAVNDRIQAMESSEEEQPSNLGCNGTRIHNLDPNDSTLASNWTNFASSRFDLAAALGGGNSTYKAHSELDPFPVPYPASGTTETKWSSTTMAAAASTPTPQLSLNNTSVPNHPLIIGAPTSETMSTTNEGTSLGVVMVFRSNMEPESWCRTKQDVDTPSERQKALENYRDIGLASQDATVLDHWAVIDKIQSKSYAGPSPKTNSTPSGNATGRVVSSDDGSSKIRAPVGYWSDSGISTSSDDGQTGDVQSGEATTIIDPSVDDASSPPKPVINVAYFGDSGRSAPVPPDQQADFARPIMVVDPLAKLHVASGPAVAHSKDLDEPEEDVSGVYPTTSSCYDQADQSSTPGVMAAMSKSRIGALGIPIDASD
ncbi:hypothetical protein OPQ81_008114 [Rhizoctonia solani]|nr:hypothetical protein OPQ81_008114 [Rhizoctonia solani]